MFNSILVLKVIAMTAKINIMYLALLIKMIQIESNLVSCLKIYLKEYNKKIKILLKISLN